MEGHVYLLYCPNNLLRAQLETLLADFTVESASSRKALEAPPAHARAIICGMTTCAQAEVRRLRPAFGPLRPPVVLVATLSTECLRRLTPLRGDRIRVVWAEEAERQLRHVLGDLEKDGRDPLRRVGVRLLSDYPLRPSLKEAISRVCGQPNHPDAIGFVPENSVSRLADRVCLRRVVLTRYWRREIPLRCNLKRFLSWSVLLWAVWERSRGNWAAVAYRVGLRRRTLERSCRRLAGCTLGTAAEDPQMVVQRFEEWIESVWDPEFGDESEPGGPASEE